MPLYLASNYGHSTYCSLHDASHLITNHLASDAYIHFPALDDRIRLYVIPEGEASCKTNEIAISPRIVEVVMTVAGVRSAPSDASIASELYAVEPVCCRKSEI